MCLVCLAVDDVGDMDVNTGPCYSGTRRFVGKQHADAHSVTVHEADVVLISASGNHVGHMVSRLFVCSMTIMKKRAHCAGIFIVL